MKPLFSHCVLSKSKTSRSINLYEKNLCQTSADYDIIVCSAFKGGYAPTNNSMIGSLFTNRKISVDALSKDPDIDLRSIGCWLSKNTGTAFKRVACVEILDYEDRDTFNSALSSKENTFPISRLLKTSFSTLRYLLERASIDGISIKNIAMPILGAGIQNIPLEYISIPLISQSLAMFEAIESLESIDIFEVNTERAQRFAAILQDYFSPREEGKRKFISYSSVQSNTAHKIQSLLINNGFNVWIAPESIPTGSNYLTEITKALESAQLIILLLTEEAQNSPWVRREIASAVGAGKTVLPIQLYSFSLNQEYKFLLESIQILPIWKIQPNAKDQNFLLEVSAKLLPGDIS